MTMITAGLGVYVAQGITAAGLLVDNTFDKSLMSVSYARAAAAEFASMQAVLTRRWLMANLPDREELDQRIEALSSSLDEDLAIAAERAQSPRAATAARAVRAAISAWQVARHRLVADSGNPEVWRVLDESLDKATAKVELLINYTAGDGFLYRQRARTMVASDRRFSLGATAVAVLLSAIVVWLLARRITRPVAAASAAAERIARGDLDAPIPKGGKDELGVLLEAMAIMRDNIRAMMDRQVAQRRSAEGRLANALQSSREGVIVLDSHDRVVMANAQAAEFLGKAELWSEIEDRTFLGRALTGVDGEVRVGDRWLRVSRSATQDGGSVVVCTDLTALKDKEARLEASHAWLDAALSNMVQGLCLFDANDRLQVVNRRFCELFQLAPGSVSPGVHLAELLELAPFGFCDAARADNGRSASGLLQSGTEPVGAQLLELPDGRVIAVQRRIIDSGHWIATFEDVSARRAAEAKIVHMARHDALTALPNRNFLLERLDQAIAQLGRDGGHCSVLFLDLDRFKAVNDTLGHAAGDMLLRTVAERLQSCVREVDTVARLGGDEFAVVQSGLDRPEDGAVLARRIVQVLGEPYDIGGHRVSISTSVGISVAPADGTLSQKLLKNADMALYKAKADGRATWRFFEAEMNARLQARRALEADLREALAEDALEVFYQPLFDVAKSRIGGFEALLRWRHPTRGMVPPSEFIPVAEEIGLIVPLGEWVLRRACLQALSWPGHVKVAVNVSPAQFTSGRLLETVRQALVSSGLLASRLELEITESVLLSDGAATLATLTALKDLGVCISMDDFGTGYSSLSYLRSFPFDKIKIDQSFVRDLNTSHDADVIVRTMIMLGHSLGMRVTAEGVEREEQLAWLKAEGCTEAQGYLFSPAAPATDIEALLEEKHHENVAGCV
jgi:diguanylate cyclase (GGDEF)-like protein